ncbi:hypothetical protein J6590_075063 [Homalodisca vitripennis]|nr:hypothetical protein J6590_075063 [Homalodisca vitripennis]
MSVQGFIAILEILVVMLFTALLLRYCIDLLLYGHRIGTLLYSGSEGKVKKETARFWWRPPRLPGCHDNGSKSLAGLAAAVYQPNASFTESHCHRCLSTAALYQFPVAN